MKHLLQPQAVKRVWQKQPPHWPGLVGGGFPKTRVFRAVLSRQLGGGLYRWGIALQNLRSVFFKCLSNRIYIQKSAKNKNVEFNDLAQCNVWVATTQFMRQNFASSPEALPFCLLFTDHSLHSPKVTTPDFVENTKHEEFLFLNFI